MSSDKRECSFRIDSHRRAQAIFFCWRRRRRSGTPPAKGGGKKKARHMWGRSVCTAHIPTLSDRKKSVKAVQRRTFPKTAKLQKVRADAAPKQFADSWALNGRARLS